MTLRTLGVDKPDSFNEFYTNVINPLFTILSTPVCDLLQGRVTLDWKT